VSVEGLVFGASKWLGLPGKDKKNASFCSQEMEIWLSYSSQARAWEKDRDSLASPSTGEW
jgi:predicted GH43/DUF377 family glycosyl hydrolase